MTLTDVQSMSDATFFLVVLVGSIALGYVAAVLWDLAEHGVRKRGPDL